MAASSRLTAVFLSTLPARGATPRRGPPCKNRSYFYPRSPRGERRQRSPFLHTPGALFLSTLPARGATENTGTEQAAVLFLSTLPARGATTGHSQAGGVAKEFLSTLPARGATIIAQQKALAAEIFLSTLPARGATSGFFGSC